MFNWSPCCKCLLMFMFTYIVSIACLTNLTRHDILQLAQELDELYIDGPCDSKILTGILLSRFEGVSHVTPVYKDIKPMCNPLYHYQ